MTPGIATPALALASATPTSATTHHSAPTGLLATMTLATVERYGPPTLSADPDTAQDGWFPPGAGPTSDIGTDDDDDEYFSTGGRPFIPSRSI